MTAGVDGSVVLDECAWVSAFSLSPNSLLLYHLIVSPYSVSAMLNGATIQLDRLLRTKMWSSRQALAAGVAYGLATTLNHR